MKILFFLHGILILPQFLLAQLPQKINYQMVLRSSTSNLLINTSVSIRIQILRGTDSGTIVYTEFHNPTTNNNGLVTLEIGTGTSPIGKFSEIDWGAGTYFLKTETDPSNGNNYSISGVSQILSVPYSLHSGNGLLKVSVTGDTLFLGNGRWILVPGISSTNPSISKTDSVVTDIDGNLYETIQIGNQIWMKQNLRATRYNNNIPVAKITDNTEWGNTSLPAWCYYNNDINNDIHYGKLYNQYTIMNQYNICPIGWHAATDAEWARLATFMGGSLVAGGKLKASGIAEEGTGFWSSPNIDANNSSNFSAKPGGVRDNLGNFSGKGLQGGTEGYWWTKSLNGLSLLVSLSSLNGYVDWKFYSKNFGCSIRCIKN